MMKHIKLFAFLAVLGITLSLAFFSTVLFLLTPIILICLFLFLCTAEVTIIEENNDKSNNQ